MLLKFGLTVSVIGVAIVFIELVLLIIIFKILARVTEVINSRGENKNLQTLVGSEQNSETPLLEEAGETDAGVVAAIAAAIGYITQEVSAITAIKRIHGVSGSAWSQAGRQETMSLRQ